MVIDDVERLMRLMKEYGVPHIQVGDVQIEMPYAATGPNPEAPPRRPAGIEQDPQTGEVLADPDLYAAVGP